MILGALAGSGMAQPSPEEIAPVRAAAPPAAPGEPDADPLPAPRLQGKSRWLPVRWAELPGFAEDALHEAWNAWLRSCERPHPAFAALCPEVRRLAIG